jgi:hypothetical protein
MAPNNKLAWCNGSTMMAIGMLFCLLGSTISSVYAASATATVSATILQRSDVAEVSTDISTEVAANSWTQLLYSGSAGILTFTIPGNGLQTAGRGNYCKCALTGTPAQIATLVSCNGSKTRSCASSVNTQQLDKVMACSGIDNMNDFCTCEITGSVDQIAALLFCNGTLLGSKVVSLMIIKHQNDEYNERASIIAAYN